LLHFSILVKREKTYDDDKLKSNTNLHPQTLVIVNFNIISTSPTINKSNNKNKQYKVSVAHPTDRLFIHCFQIKLEFKRVGV